LKKFKGIALIVSFLFLAQNFGQIVRQISFENLTETNVNFLKNHIDTKENTILDEKQIKNDVQLIKNLNLFLAVDYKTIQNSDSSVNVIFIIKESKYLYPIFTLGGFGKKINFSLGFGHINFRGRAQSLGFFYQFYDRHSFNIYHNVPFHKNTKTGHDFSLGIKGTIEPLYFSNEARQFKYDNYHISLGAHRWLNRFIKFGFGGMSMYELYQNNQPTKSINEIATDGTSASPYETSKRFSLFKIQARSFLSYTRVNYMFERRSGLSATLFAENIQTFRVKDASFFKLTNDLSLFRIVGKNGNIAFRNKIGISTNNDSPFSPFVIDGYVNIRGSGDRVARGTGELIFNLEYQYTVWRHKYFVLQTNTYADVGYIRSAGAKIKTAFQSNNSYYFSGIGVRLQSRFLYNTTLRIDYGANLKNASNRSFTFGLGHFF
jgi:outer membrane protein insertion porin family